MKLKDALKDNKAIGFFSNFVESNSATLAMIGGIGMMAVAIVAAFKASQDVVKAKEEFDQEVQKLAAEGEDLAQNAEKMKHAKIHRNVSYILAYRWVCLFGVGSALAMFFCNYIHGIQAAGLSALAAYKKDEIKKMAENGKKLIGEEKYREIEDMTLEDLVMQNFMGKEGGMALKPGEYRGDMFVDTNQGILFQMHEDDLRETLLKAQQECERNHGLSEVRYMENFLGLEAPKRARHFWGPRRPFKATIGERKLFGCTFRSIEYDKAPTSGYDAGIPGYSK